MDKKVMESVRLAQIVSKEEEIECDNPCPTLYKVQERLHRGDQILAAIPHLVDSINALNTRIENMEKKLDDTKGIVEAWGNIRGFGRTMSFVSDFLKVAAPIVMFIGFIYLLFSNPQLAIEKAKLWTK